MKAYYNEIDKYCVEWLRNLIAEGLIADGDVDARSIGDVRPNDLRGYTQCHFFAGLGGWSAALRKAAWPDHRPVWTGSCPCQPFSLAGKQRGFADERHLWPYWCYLIGQCRPAIVLGEQVASGAAWLRLVRSDLEALGYAVGAIPVEAACAGADHLRDRYWFVGHAIGARQLQPQGRECDIGRWTGDAGSVGHGACEPEREPHDAGDTIADGRQTRPVSGGAGGTSGAIGLAHPDQPGASEERQQRSGQFGGAGCDQETCALGNALADSSQQQQHGGGNARAVGWDEYPDGGSWVIGADGKARRVKPGIRLLVDGVPSRVAKLRALGNAIDLRPAAAFIDAVASSPSS